MSEFDLGELPWRKRDILEDGGRLDDGHGRLVRTVLKREDKFAVNGIDHDEFDVRIGDVQKASAGGEGAVMCPCEIGERGVAVRKRGNVVRIGGYRHVDVQFAAFRR